MPNRLNAESLNALPASVARPAYDRAKLETGIVHLGIGAFHRAHQAVFTEAAISAGDLRWGIVGASLRSPDTRNALAPQDALYAVGVRDVSGEKISVIGAIQRVLVAPEDPEALLSIMAQPSVKIVSLTVTEKGYCHDPATGALNETHPDILHDLETPKAPRSAPGFIVEALARRRATGLPPFTVLCCDNLPANGHTVKRVLSRLAHLRDAALGAWFDAHVACPSTMVDRIVPATTDEDRARISASLGVRDAWSVVTEPFIQWVVEDDFPHGRPDWTGVDFTRDVAAFEAMKLRLLNGSHSCIAYFGCLAGYETVADAMQDENLVRFIRAYMDEEATPTLRVPQGFDVAAYKEALIQRFRNPALRHKTAQIAMDGSQKLPQRWLAAARERLATGQGIERIAFGVAAWMRYATGNGERGETFEIRDPLAAHIAAHAAAAGLSAPALVHELCGLTQIFGADLPADPRFTGTVTSALERLIEKGAKQALMEM